MSESGGATTPPSADEEIIAEFAGFSPADAAQAISLATGASLAQQHRLTQLVAARDAAVRARVVEAVEALHTLPAQLINTSGGHPVPSSEYGVGYRDGLAAAVRAARGETT